MAQRRRGMPRRFCHGLLCASYCCSAYCWTGSRQVVPLVLGAVQASEARMLPNCALNVKLCCSFAQRMQSQTQPKKRKKNAEVCSLFLSQTQRPNLLSCKANSFSCDEGLGEVVEASATATSISPDLPPPDTVVGSLKFASGTPAGISVTFAGSVLRFSLSVTGTAGSLEVLLLASFCECSVGVSQTLLHGLSVLHKCRNAITATVPVTEKLLSDSSPNADSCSLQHNCLRCNPSCIL